MPGSCGSGLVVGRPIDRAALQEAVRAARCALDDDRRACRGDVRAGAGVRDAELHRAARSTPGSPPRRSSRCWRCRPRRCRPARSASPPMTGSAKKPSLWNDVTARRLVQAAFQVAEHQRRRSANIGRARGRTAPRDRRHSSGSRRRSGSSWASRAILDSSEWLVIANRRRASQLAGRPRRGNGWISRNARPARLPAFG